MYLSCSVEVVSIFIHKIVVQVKKQFLHAISSLGTSETRHGVKASVDGGFVTIVVTYDDVFNPYDIGELWVG